MKTKLAFLVLILVAVTGYTQTWQWTHVEPGSNGTSYGYQVVNDAAGNDALKGKGFMQCA